MKTIEVMEVGDWIECPEFGFSTITEINHETTAKAVNSCGIVWSMWQSGFIWDSARIMWVVK